MNAAGSLQYWVEELQTAAEAGLEWLIPLDRGQAIMPPGHNGPYFDIQGPIRNTAHWLVTFSVLHSITGVDRYRKVGLRLARFLREPGLYTGDRVFTHRQKPGKDACNGVIGQAWLVEALHRAGLHLGDSESAQLARELAERLPFDRAAGAWRRVDPRAGVLSVDYTYNHQAWFAAAKAEVFGGQIEDVKRFLDMSLAGAFRTRPDGLVVHLYFAGSPRGLLTRARHSLRSLRGVHTKERGYHLYVLYALARLHSVFPRHPFFGSRPFLAALELAFSGDFHEGLVENPYAYPYNAPGFEVLRIATEFDRFGKGFPEAAGLARRTYERQVEATLAPEVGLHVRNAPDGFTLAARIYELALGVEFMAARLRGNTEGPQTRKQQGVPL